MPIPSSDASLPPTDQASSPQPGTMAGKVSTSKNLLFLFMVIVSVIIFWPPLATVVDYALREGQHQYDKYSHIILIPFVSLGLLLWDRKKIFARVQYGYRIGTVLLLAGLVVNVAAVWFQDQLGADNSLSLRVLGLVVFCLGAFVLCYGAPAFRAGVFPLLFLLMAVPIPDPLLDVPLSAVRYGSTQMSALIFTLSGVPYLQNGYAFSLPSITIEVAKECSGIHSTLALFIVSLVAGYLFLASPVRRVLLVLFVLPVVCITNGLRIAGLTLLSVYVDPRFMHSTLHRDGGIGFFLLALLLLFGLLRLVGRRQRGQASRRDVAVE